MITVSEVIIETNSYPEEGAMRASWLTNERKLAKKNERIVFML